MPHELNEERKVFALDEGAVPAQLDHYARASGLSAVQEEICRRIMDGDGIRSICRDGGIPGKSTVMVWLTRDSQFREAYSLARQLLAETPAEEIIEISDDASQDWKSGQGGERQFDHEHVQRARLRVDSRKWLAGELAPRRYGNAALLRIDDASRERRTMSATEKAVRMASIVAAAEKEKEKRDGNSEAH